MIPIKQASSIISKNLLNNVNNSKFITHACTHRRWFSNKMVKFPMVTFYEPLKDRYSNIVGWYREIIGFKEVQAAHEKVVVAGEKLEILQEQRREAWSNLTRIQKEVRENYTELERTRKIDERYLELVKKEHRLLTEEEALKEVYRNAEMAERNQFNYYTNAVRNSHELEKIEMEKRKYISLIASVVGALVGIIASSINHYFKMSEIKLVLSKVPTESFSEQLQVQLERIENLTKAFSKFEENHDTVNSNSLYKKLKGKLVSMKNFVMAVPNRDERKWLIPDSDYSSYKMWMYVLPTGIICVVGLIILGKVFE